jgi:hypothetical protein
MTAFNVVRFRVKPGRYTAKDNQIVMRIGEQPPRLRSSARRRTDE